ncbi:hypothetical protein BZ13_564 [Francisella philomiragia subsp. philomiragia ATCC 25015]|uniref:hypothetical protein n=1 Tax=Francisella philomiragia TaxID=28110 RepID=UPI0001AF77CE|nr:hypothetical protein [Francisella philomiragia]AJI74779.1 hypothetical protein BZ13_564 [Francisella philomiragia subsp. philomiragia ATCC 25015]EET21189.1 predicted protein [Francisella philomiragia subsp. philomiragia ATCC 25015]MBK2238842.1 hypothetical protein [Francisella philomiragia]
MKRKILATSIVMALSVSAGYSACTLDNATNSQMTFTCDSQTDLTKDAITLDIADGATFGASIWGGTLPDS